MPIEQNILLACDTIAMTPQRKVLLIQRKNEPYKGDWAMPGGFAEDDEDIAETAARELLEETSVRVESADLIQLKTYGKPGRDPRGRTVSVVFYCLLDCEPIATAADDAAAAQWFPLDDLPALAFDHHLAFEDFLEAIK